MAHQMEMRNFQMFHMVCNSSALCLQVRIFKQITDVERTQDFMHTPWWLAFRIAGISEIDFRETMILARKKVFLLSVSEYKRSKKP